MRYVKKKDFRVLAAHANDLKVRCDAAARRAWPGRCDQDLRNPATMIGAQVSNEQLEKILSYIDIGKEKGAKLLAGGERAKLVETSRVATTCVPRCFMATTRCASSRRKA